MNPAKLSSSTPTSEARNKAEETCSLGSPDVNGISLATCGAFVRYHPQFRFCPYCGKQLRGQPMESKRRSQITKTQIRNGLILLAAIGFILGFIVGSYNP